MWRPGLAIITLCGLVTAVWPQGETPEALVQGLMSDDAATRVAAETAAVKLGAPMVKPLCDLLAAGDTKSVTVAERMLFAIAAAASAPGNQAHADAVAAALAAQAERAACPEAQTCALRLQALLGEPGARALPAPPTPADAPALAAATASPDEAVRSAAVGALIALADAEQQRGGDLARRCYRKAYDCAVTPAQRTAALMGLADTDPSLRVHWLLKGMGETHSRRLAQAELLKLDAAQLAGPLAQRMAGAQGEELEALRALAAERGLLVADH